MKLRNKTKRIVSAVVLSAMLAAPFSILGNVVEIRASQYGLSNPTIERNVVISGNENSKQDGSLSAPLVRGVEISWDCIYFGRYWQEDTNGDGVVNQNDEKQPIKWRVLSVNGDDAFLMASQNMDCQPYNNSEKEVTWETCTLRKWLNSSFISNAFSSEEQEAINLSMVKNDDNPYYKTEAGKDTMDKIYLLSIQEATDSKYGFCSSAAKRKAREAKNTTYAKNQGVYTTTRSYEGNGEWLLRSPGDGATSAANVDESGLIWGNGHYVSCDVDAVRPVLHLNLSTMHWKQAGREKEIEVSSSTWNRICFGNYWQNDTNNDGVVDEKDEKTPIKWRVLSVDGDNAFLIADQGIDCMPYNEKYAEVTWETCTLRSWLNSTFLTNAFSQEERDAISETTVINDDNPYCDVEGGNNTKDKVYLLSISEAANVSYGFDDRFDAQSMSRVAHATSYAVEHGTELGQMERIAWWLRSPGSYGSAAAAIDKDGHGLGALWGGTVSNSVESKKITIRPALHLSLSNPVWVEDEAVTCGENKYAPQDTEEEPLSPEPPSKFPVPTKIPSTPSATVTPTPTNTPSVSDKSVSVANVKVTIKSVKNKKGKKVIATWKKVTGARGYQIAYSTNKKFKSKKIKNVTKTTVTLSKLKKKKTYYIKVRAYTKVNGKKVYGKWSEVKKVKVKK